MKVTIIYDNKICRPGLEKGWGFSCLLKSEGIPSILFDTGGNGRALISNMEKLGIDPCLIDEIFISHSHHDHVGGLPSFLKINDDVKIYVPSSFSPHEKAKEIISIKEAQQIHENVFTTGELKSGFFSGTGEQSLIIKKRENLSIIAGCSHPGVEQILNAASRFGEPNALIGGLHGFNNYEVIENLDLICPTHCTQHESEIRSRFPKKYTEGGVGKIIEL